MARTVRTGARPPSPPSSEGSESGGESGDEYNSNQGAGSAVAVAAPSASAGARSASTSASACAAPAPRAMGSSVACNDDSVKISDIVARMPSSSRDERAVAPRYSHAGQQQHQRKQPARQQQRWNRNHQKQPWQSWDDDRGGTNHGRDGRGRGGHGRGGSHTYRGQEGGHDYGHYDDRQEFGDGRELRYQGSARRQEDGGWGRKREWQDEDYDGRHHYRYRARDDTLYRGGYDRELRDGYKRSSIIGGERRGEYERRHQDEGWGRNRVSTKDDAPHRRCYRDYSSYKRPPLNEHADNGSGYWEYRNQPKRQRYNHHPGGTNETRNGHGSREWHRPRPWPREQDQSFKTKVLRELRLVKEQVSDLNEAKKSGGLNPAIMGTDHVMALKSSNPSLSMSSSHLAEGRQENDSLTASSLAQQQPTSQSKAGAQLAMCRVRDEEGFARHESFQTAQAESSQDVAGETSANAVVLTQATALPGGQTRNAEEQGNEHDSCYDLSTEEEVTFDNNSGQDDDGESSSDECDSRKEANAQSSKKHSNRAHNCKDSNNQDINHRASDGEKESESKSHEEAGLEEDGSDNDSVDPALEDIDPLGKVSFCCQNCRCYESSLNKFLKVSQIRNNCGNSGDHGNGNVQLYHKACCHHGTNIDANYLSPMQKAIEASINGEGKKQLLTKQQTQNEIRKRYNTAKREEAQFENEEAIEASDCSIYGNEVYSNCCQNFRQRRKTRKTSLRVLDLFAGIGSAAVVLKRLKLPVDLIVHVEHDPVAVYVSKFNHKNDGITHHYIDTFEQIYGQNREPDDEEVQAFLDKYGGSFDLVLAGTPCQNYSGLNASRDPNSQNAQYLPKVGRLIQKMDEIQMANGVKDKVMFLSENVVFKDHDSIDRFYGEGGLAPICLDAKDFSPCKRKRFYWLNTTVNSTEKIKEVASAVSVDHGLLDNGYGAVARLLQDDIEKMTTPVKANTFLASLSRIDDNRMIKYMLEDDSASGNSEHTINTYSVAERERMMGLPVGYIGKPMKKLFEELTQKAFIKPETSSEGETYRDFLPREFWHFRKMCHFKFLPTGLGRPPYFELALSSPMEARSQESFYTEEQYGKHLIGNGWSIPVVEHLLENLRELFSDDVVMPAYNNYGYRFPWEPYKTH